MDGSSIISERVGLSCAEAGNKMNLSVLGMLALRLGLMLLRWSMKWVSDRYQLAVTVSSQSLIIRVSRRRVGASGPKAKPSTSSGNSDALGSSSTATTDLETDPLPPDVLSSDLSNVLPSEERWSTGEPIGA